MHAKIIGDIQVQLVWQVVKSEMVPITVTSSELNINRYSNRILLSLTVNSLFLSIVSHII
uniref:Uncharacterized protein n=1 Tax=Parascaris equorum TaxID=6256 RepID=A0A914RRA3_PAREQ